MLKQPKAIDFDKPVPAPEDVDQELAALRGRQAKLTAEIQKIDSEQRAIWAEMATGQAEDRRRTQVDALIRGLAYEPPAPMREKLAELAKRRSLILEAQEELSRLVLVRRNKASRLVAQEFEAERQALAREFYKHIAAAVRAHSKFGDIRLRLARAGVDDGYLPDFGKDLVGAPNSSRDHAASALRLAVRSGWLEASEIPPGYGVVK